MSKCNTCVYRFRDEHRTACGYILCTGEQRGCEVKTAINTDMENHLSGQLLLELYRDVEVEGE